MCVYVCERTCAGVFVWRSEGNLGPVPSFHSVGPDIKLRLEGLTASIFSCLHFLNVDLFIYLCMAEWVCTCRGPEDSSGLCSPLPCAGQGRSGVQLHCDSRFPEFLWLLPPISAQEHQEARVTTPASYRESGNRTPEFRSARLVSLCAEPSPVLCDPPA